MLSSSTPFLFLTQGGFQDILKYKLTACFFVRHALAGTCKHFRLQFYDKDMAHILYYVASKGRSFLTSEDELNMQKLLYVLFPFICIPNLKDQLLVSPQTNSWSIFLDVSVVPFIKNTRYYPKQAAERKEYISVGKTLQLNVPQAPDAILLHCNDFASNEFVKTLDYEKHSTSRENTSCRFCECCSQYYFSWYWNIFARGILIKIK